MNKPIALEPTVIPPKEGGMPTSKVSLKIYQKENLLQITLRLPVYLKKLLALQEQNLFLVQNCLLQIRITKKLQQLLLYLIITVLLR